MSGPFTRRTPRVAAAARLRRRRIRDQTGRFLVEGSQAVREALAASVPAGGDGIGGPGTSAGPAGEERARDTRGPAVAVYELFATEAAMRRHRDLVDSAVRAAVPVSLVTDDAMTVLAETVAPQGLVAVCGQRDTPLADLLAGAPRLVAVLVEIRDPGNAGTVLRTADAAGAHAVVFAGDAVDPYNGKCVRASAGSLFHLPIVRAPDPVDTLEQLRAAGLRVLAATGTGEEDLDVLQDTGALGAPTAWLFGSEAHGLPAALLAAADARVRVPIHGRAESLNLGAAAAVCLYASARALRDKEPGA